MILLNTHAWMNKGRGRTILKIYSKTIPQVKGELY